MRQVAGAAGTHKTEQRQKADATAMKGANQKAVIEKDMARKMERHIHQATLLVHSKFLACWSF